jgi:hypothetical protein
MWLALTFDGPRLSYFAVAVVAALRKLAPATG